MKTITSPFYIIISHDSQTKCKHPKNIYLSFSKVKHDICFGHTVENVIPDYTLDQYLKQYGKQQITIFVNSETDLYKMPKYDKEVQISLLDWFKTIYPGVAKNYSEYK
jgi:hypothetical protein